MHIFFSVIGIILTIFFVVGTHEYAHFLTARFLGIKVLRFSIGFGKTLLKWKDRETEYVIALVPLGGYVKMLDENEEPVAPSELHRAFNRQPFYKKFLVVLAGPLTNIVCAIFLYWIIFIIGFPTLKPIIGQVTPNSIAAKAGLMPQQQIIAVDDKIINGWPNTVFRLLVHVGNHDVVKLTVKNAQQQISSHQLNLAKWEIGELNPDPLKSLGITPYEPKIPLIIGEIKPQSPALEMLRVGDKIIAMDNKPITNWQTLVEGITLRPNQILTLTVLRNNKPLNVSLTIGSKRHIFTKPTGYLGISPKIIIPKNLLQEVRYSPVKALQQAAQEAFDLTYFNLILFGKMLTGKLSLQSLGGPITIFEVAGSALDYGILPFLGFLAFLSISIGIINLLPIPGLDGGHLVIYFFEFVLQRPIPINFLNLLFRLGFIFIFVILIQALVNDFLRL